MIAEPGLLAGRIDSPKPQRGPEASQRMSFAIYISATAKPRTAAITATIASSDPCVARLPADSCRSNANRDIGRDWMLWFRYQDSPRQKAGSHRQKA